MANMASVAYAIEGSEESLKTILEVVNEACKDKKHWTEWTACRLLGFPESELRNHYLGGEIDEGGEIIDGVLRLWAEERWGLQDFHRLLKQKFPDIKVYWKVQEEGNEVYCKNDVEGKYFPERYWVDTAQDDEYQSEYFETLEEAYKWLDRITNGRVKCAEDVEKFNSDYEDSGDDLENFIYIHEFEIEDDN